MGFLILFADMKGLISTYVLVASQSVLSSFYANTVKEVNNQPKVKHEIKGGEIQ